jgi:hypothetical protein
MTLDLLERTGSFGPAISAAVKVNELRARWDREARQETSPARRFR